MKVLHLPIVICNQPWLMSRSLRKIGIESDYMILDDSDASWLLPGKPDYNLGVFHVQDNHTKKRLERKIYHFFINSLFKYDVFHFHSNYSLFEDYRDLKILKKFRKKIVVSYWGCDIRRKSINSQYKYNTCEVCKVHCDEKKINWQTDIVSKYADLTIAHSYELLEYAPKGSVFLPSFIDLDSWQSRGYFQNKDNTFKVFHIFGNSAARGDVRGSSEIEKAVENLKKKGFKIEFMFLDKIPNADLKKYTEDADVVVEQLRYGTYGLTALEAMALEKPVIGYIRKECRDKYLPDKIPIIDANIDNIEEVLKWAMLNRKELDKVGKEGRNFVRKYHDSNILACKLYNLYKNLY